MDTIHLPNKDTAMQYVKESLERGIGVMLAPNQDSTVTVHTWDREPLPNLKGN